MTWIALKMLTGDKAKFFGIVLGLTFAALLITQQGSIFCGLMLRTSGQIADITGADLWVMDPNVRYVDDVKPMIETNLYRVRGVEGVEWAVPLYKGTGRAKLSRREEAAADHARFVLQTRIAAERGRPASEVKPPRPVQKHNDVIEQVILLGLDDSSLVGAPRRLFVGSYSDLRRPDAIIVDKVGLRKIFPGQGFESVGEDDVDVLRAVVGRELEMNDHRAVIVGVCEATRTFQSNAVVYTTYSRTKSFVPSERKPLTYILAKTGAGQDPDKVALAIAKQTGLGAKTSAQFQWMTIQYFLKYTGIPVNFGITALLGFLVGTAIAGQTFYNFTIENLKQFGALKAMGTTNGKIVGMILLQATVTGLLGYGIGVGLAAWFGIRSKGTELAFYTPWWLLPITGGAVVFICILASILSVRRVVVLEPAVVFRG